VEAEKYAARFRVYGQTPLRSFEKLRQRLKPTLREKGSELHVAARIKPDVVGSLYTPDKGIRSLCAKHLCISHPK
jgi:hypothetical protein